MCDASSRLLGKEEKDVVDPSHKEGNMSVFHAELEIRRWRLSSPSTGQYCVRLLLRVRTHADIAQGVKNDIVLWRWLWQELPVACPRCCPWHRYEALPRYQLYLVISGKNARKSKMMKYSMWESQRLEEFGGRRGLYRTVSERLWHRRPEFAFCVQPHVNITNLHPKLRWTVLMWAYATENWSKSTTSRLVNLTQQFV